MRQSVPKVLLLGNGPDGSNVSEILARFASVTTSQQVPAVFPVSEEGYDAIFSQWQFAGGTWRDLLKKTEELGVKSPVIVLSHCGSEEQWIEALQEGAFDFLVPPYMNYQILAVLEHAIASRRSAEESRSPIAAGKR